MSQDILLGPFAYGFGIGQELSTDRAFGLVNGAMITRQFLGNAAKRPYIANLPAEWMSSEGEGHGMCLVSRFARCVKKVRKKKFMKLIREKLNSAWPVHFLPWKAQWCLLSMDPDLHKDCR